MASKKADSSKDTVPVVGDVLWVKDTHHAYMSGIVETWRRRYVVLSNQQYIYISKSRAPSPADLFPERIKKSCISYPKSDWRDGKSPANWVRSWAEACARDKLESMRDELRRIVNGKISSMDEAAIQNLASTLGITLTTGTSDIPPEPPEY